MTCDQMRFRLFYKKVIRYYASHIEIQFSRGQQQRHERNYSGGHQRSSWSYVTETKHKFQVGASAREGGRHHLAGCQLEKVAASATVDNFGNTFVLLFSQQRCKITLLKSCCSACTLPQSPPSCPGSPVTGQNMKH